MRRWNSLIITLGLAGSFGVAFAAGRLLRAPQSQATLPNVRAAGTQVAELPATTLPGTATDASPGAEPETQGFSLFETVYGLVRSQYVDNLPDKNKMAHGAVRAMLSSLDDPHSTFVEASSRQLIEQEGKGILGGIGAALTIRGAKQDGFTDYRVTVVAPVAGSPAAAAGLKPGDTVQKVDGRYVFGHSPLLAYNRILQRWQDRDVTDEEVEQVRKSTKARIENGMPFRDAELLLRGDRGAVKSDAAKAVAKKDRFSLTVLRAGKSIDVPVTLSQTKVEPVSVQPVNASTVLLKIPFFGETAGKDVRAALAGAAGKNVIVDLRGNPGGDIDAGQAVAGALVGPGAFCVEIGPKGSRQTLKTTGNAIKLGKIAVLTDRGTASVSEALTLCLVERRSAPVVGQTTFGDGLLQGLYTLDDGSGFTLNVGTLTGKTNGWVGKGLVPTVAIPATTAQAAVIAKAVQALGGGK
ncbi:MAG: S41 family peptidase [Armatimonadota bacterium]